MHSRLHSNVFGSKQRGPILPETTGTGSACPEVCDCPSRSCCSACCVSSSFARSHRERKNEYIFGIEQELRRVRDQHIKQILEVENENQQLRNILAAYQIVVPPPLRNAPVVEESEIYGQQSHFAQIRVHRSQSSVPPMGVSITPTGEKRMLTTHYGSTPRNGGSQQAEETDLEEIQMAVNFVLA